MDKNSLSEKDTRDLVSISVASGEVGREILRQINVLDRNYR